MKWIMPRIIFNSTKKKFKIHNKNWNNFYSLTCDYIMWCMHNNKKLIHISKNLFVSLAIRKKNYILFGSASIYLWFDMTQVKINAIFYIDIDWHSKLSFTICWVKSYHYFIIRSWWYTLINSLMRLLKIQKLCFFWSPDDVHHVCD